MTNKKHLGRLSLDRSGPKAIGGPGYLASLVLWNWPLQRDPQHPQVSVSTWLWSKQMWHPEEDASPDPRAQPQDPPGLAESPWRWTDGHD